MRVTGFLATGLLQTIPTGAACFEHSRQSQTQPGKNLPCLCSFVDTLSSTPCALHRSDMHTQGITTMFDPHKAKLGTLHTAIQTEHTHTPEEIANAP